jgi:cobalt/nickel transport system permease protein
MHMADALVSPAVGGMLWAASGGLIAYSAREVRRSLDERRVPLMGVLGAFVFAAQMINFTIPGTGSSGHLGGGLLLAILLGPCPAFLAIASVLTVQALFFADGGLLALGCNIFNLGFVPCFLAYPLVYRPLAGHRPSPARMAFASISSAVIALQIGALCVVLETRLSGVSDLPFWRFVLLMQPIHLAIGLVEGLATAAIAGFIRKARPEVLELHESIGNGSAGNLRPVITAFLIAAVAIGGGLSWFASTHPDGLEWSISRASGKEELAQPASTVHRATASLQERTAVLPDYGSKFTGDQAREPAGSRWPAPDAGTTVSGIVGGSVTLALVVLAGWALKRRRAAAKA